MVRGHDMRINSTAFNAIKNGTKLVELRLYDEKRKSIKIGDVIKFSLNDYSDYVEVKVNGLLRANSFDNLLNVLDISKTSSRSNNINDTIKNLREYYSIEDENKYGVLGILFELKK